MTAHIREESFPGQIDIGGTRSPVTYKLNAREDEGGSYHVAVSLIAPRDWLLKHGFRKDALLLCKSGRQVPVHLEKPLDVDDNVAVTLHGDEAHLDSMDEVRRQFPELKAS